MSSLLPEKFSPIPEPDDPRRCHAKRRSTGEQCKRWAIPGGPVCTKHGGKSPHIANAAKRRLAIADINKRLADLEVEPIGDPVEELAQLAAEDLTVARWIMARINAIRADDFRYVSEHGIEQLRAEMIVWERARDRVGKWLTDLAKLGLDERRVRLSELQAGLMVGVLRRVLESLQLTPEQQSMAPEIMQRELKAAGRAIEVDSIEVQLAEQRRTMALQAQEQVAAILAEEAFDTDEWDVPEEAGDDFEAPPGEGGVPVGSVD